MSRDGTGVMSVSYPDFQSGAIISDSEMDANFADIVTELTNSIPRDGQAAPTANIPFGTYKITGLGAGAAATDSANFGQIQAQAYIWCATATGSKNALSLTPSPPITAYAAGQSFRFKAGAAASDDAVTVAISGLATKAIQSSGAALSASVYIEANQWYEIVYDGAAFQLAKISLGATQDLSAYATLASPTFTGTVQMSYLSVSQIAALTTVSTSYLSATTISGAGTGLTGTAASLSVGGSAGSATNATNLDGSISSGTTATTQTAGDNSTKVATTAFVTTALSGAFVSKDQNYNEVGSFCFAYSTGAVDPGATAAGSGLRPCSIYGAISTTTPNDNGGIFYKSTALSGTWRCLGATNNASGGSTGYATLWQRTA